MSQKRPSQGSRDQSQSRFAILLAPIPPSATTPALQELGAQIGLEALEDTLAMAEAQRILKSLDLRKIAKENPPPQSWFDGDEPKPF